MTSPISTPALVLGRVAPTLPVRDIVRACRAYRAAFGFETVFENGDPVGFAILRKDAAELHLTLRKDTRPVAFNRAHILVSDADEACRRCVAQGFRIIKSVQDKEYGLRAFVFADLDGNRIDVGQVI